MMSSHVLGSSRTRGHIYLFLFFAVSDLKAHVLDIYHLLPLLLLLRPYPLPIFCTLMCNGHVLGVSLKGSCHRRMTLRGRGVCSRLCTATVHDVPFL